MFKPHNQRIIAIVVTFFPESKCFSRTIASLSKQCDSIIVVDNTPLPSSNEITELLKGSESTLISLGSNFGIAYAQNVGLELALKLNADFVLMMDQDSIPEEEMVSRLYSAFEYADTTNLIAAGPSYIDTRTNIRSYFIINRFGFLTRYKVGNQNPSADIIDVAFLISSGTLISAPKLKTLGGMRSNYFIDHVDTEWCLRAKASGFSLAGVFSARMEHSLGDSVKRVWFLYLRSVPYHSPLRDYYMFRNTILMICDVKIYFLWKCLILFRLFPFAVYFLLFSKERRIRCNKIYLGLKHGLLGIDGELNSDTGICTPIPKTKLDPVI
jgi:rhamnosyltransferase